MKLHNYQLKMIEQLRKGVKSGELYIISTPRQTGKTLYKQVLNAMYNGHNVTLGMPEPKYKFSRANWYQAEFNDKDYFEVDAWCEQHFGPHPARPDAWSRWWHKFHNSILFRDEKDYVLFMLRWS